MRGSGTARCGQQPQLLPLGPCGTPFQHEAATGQSAPGARVLTCILFDLLCPARGPSEQRHLQRKEWSRARPARAAGGRGPSRCQRPRGGRAQPCRGHTPLLSELTAGGPCRPRFRQQTRWLPPAGGGDPCGHRARPGDVGPGCGHRAPGSRRARAHFAGALGCPVAS